MYIYISGGGDVEAARPQYICICICTSQVAEMSKRLGTNVSKFELESLRSQVSSLQDEARRLHHANVEMAASLRTSRSHYLL